MKTLVILMMVLASLSARAAQTVCYDPGSEAMSWLEVKIKDAGGNQLRFEKSEILRFKMQPVCFDFFPENGEIADATVMQVSATNLPHFPMCAYSHITQSLNIESYGNYFQASCKIK